MAGQLTAVAVKNAKPGRHGDGGGLYLEVKPTGRAYWIFRFMLDGKRRDMGLGSARGPGAVGLAEAREKLDPDALTPREALDALYALKRLVQPDP